MTRRKPDGEPGLFTPAPLPTAELDEAQRIACLRLIRSENVGPVTFRELINAYGGAQAALDALTEISRRAGRTIRLCPRADAERELETAARHGARPLFTIEPGYPARLAQVDVPPPLVYVLGDARILARPTIGIVGARAASAAGMKLARMFSRAFGEAGLVVVSGLARGIDSVAHGETLATGTVAVLAGGVDIVYPPENLELHRRIAENGAIVSEMPCGFEPRARDFPRRNRLISALSMGVLVVEAARRSGTLVTARHAADQGREVFAIPGNPLDPRAEGTNHLIKTGATMVTEPADVLEALEPLTGLGSRVFREPALPAPDPQPVTLSTPPETIADDERSAVWTALGPAPVALDAICQATGLPARCVRAVLIELDLAGRIERHGAGLVSRLGD